MSDLSAYKAVLALGLPECQSLHLLQMATEKLGKAMRRAAKQAGAETKVHPAIVKALRMLRNRRDAGAALHGGRFEQWQMSVDRLLPLADAIERTAPALAGGGENTEYPWESTLRPGDWLVPAEHVFGVSERLRSAEGAQFVALLHRIGERFDGLFA